MSDVGVPLNAPSTRRASSTVTVLDISDGYDDFPTSLKLMGHNDSMKGRKISKILVLSDL